MRTAFRWWSMPVLLLLLLGGAPAVSAGEEEASARDADATTRALEALKLRMEARMKEGALLAEVGRIEEALEAYRSVGELYERGMADIRELIARLPAGAATNTRDAEGEVPNAFPGRAAARAARAAQDKPGATEQVRGRRAERAVDAALRWLAAHQSPNGGWEAAGFGTWCNQKPVADGAKKPDGQGKQLHDPGVTGLAALAFLGAGYTNRGQHPHAKVVSRALRYLKNIQDPDGCFGPRSSQQFMYNHAMASLAMIEAYGMTESPIFKGSAQRALDFIAMARNPYLAWRYGVKPGDNDTSVSTWMTMCLKSAVLINQDAIRRGRPAPLTVDMAAFDGMRAWLDKVTDPDYGRVGYVQRGTGPARPAAMVDRFPADKSESMTAAGMLARILMGEDPRKSAIIQKGAQLLRKLPPDWNELSGSIDMYYWYYGTLAMFQVGGKHWATWRVALTVSVLNKQREDGGPCGYAGSWDPAGPWGADGGRVYSTALMCLCAQVLARDSAVGRVFGRKRR